MRHPAGDDLVRRAMEDEHRNADLLHHGDGVEEIAGEEMQRQARPRDARDFRKRRKRRMENEAVERVMTDHLRRDRAAE